ncbi:hypothetical protein [Xanthomonas arboricola]|uniref:hypothetical protein n=1 Tax=Xanthomonas arboricola TaxID=56448 RepID=UPI002157CC5E|nr:hypothetical protein [Xanthomonas arboricola]
MNIAIISEQITLQCSIAAGDGAARGSCMDSSTSPARELRARWHPIYVEIRSWHDRFLYRRLRDCLGPMPGARYQPVPHERTPMPTTTRRDLFKVLAAGAVVAPLSPTAPAGDARAASRSGRAASKASARQTWATALTSIPSWLAITPTPPSSRTVTTTT